MNRAFLLLFGCFWSALIVFLDNQPGRSVWGRFTIAEGPRTRIRVAQFSPIVSFWERLGLAAGGAEGT